MTVRLNLALSILSLQDFLLFLCKRGPWQAWALVHSPFLNTDLSLTDLKKLHLVFDKKILDNINKTRHLYNVAHYLLLSSPTSLFNIRLGH